MGFLLNDLKEQWKCRLNLSEFAQIVIEEDIKIFGNGNRNGFLNQIIENYIHDAEASVFERKESRKNELSKVFSSGEFKRTDPAVIERIMNALLSAYQEELLQKAHSYQKGMGKNFDLNKDVKRILDSSTESDYYQNNLITYIKAIFEEYAMKPLFERELIVYKKKVVDPIKQAITEKKKVQIKLLPRLNLESDKYTTRRCLFSPYGPDDGIVQDKTRSYNYLVGFSESINEDGTLGPRQIASFRISRIDDIRVMSSKGGYLNAEERNQLEEEMKTKGVMFLAGDLQDFKVRFTKKGLEEFHRQLFMRPRLYEENGQNTYTFHCTEVQLINYFFKFGKEVEILSPEETRDKFIKRYRESYLHYCPFKGED